MPNIIKVGGGGTDTSDATLGTGMDLGTELTAYSWSYGKPRQVIGTSPFKFIREPQLAPMQSVYYSQAAGVHVGYASSHELGDGAGVYTSSDGHKWTKVLETYSVEEDIGFMIYNHLDSLLYLGIVVYTNTDYDYEILVKTCPISDPTQWSSEFVSTGVHISEIDYNSLECNSEMQFSGMYQTPNEVLVNLGNYILIMGSDNYYELISLGYYHAESIACTSYNDQQIIIMTSGYNLNDGEFCYMMTINDTNTARGFISPEVWNSSLGGEDPSGSLYNVSRRSYDYGTIWTTDGYYFKFGTRPGFYELSSASCTHGGLSYEHIMGITFVPIDRSSIKMYVPVDDSVNSSTLSGVSGFTGGDPDDIQSISYGGDVGIVVESDFHRGRYIARISTDDCMTWSSRYYAPEYTLSEKYTSKGVTIVADGVTSKTLRVVNGALVLEDILY